MRFHNVWPVHDLKASSVLADTLAPIPSTILCLVLPAETNLCDGQEFVSRLLPDGTTERKPWAGLLRGVQYPGSTERLPPPIDSTWSVEVGGGPEILEFIDAAHLRKRGGC